MMTTGYILSGIGLIFLGIKFITTYLKNSTTLSIKEKLASMIQNPFYGFFLGGVFVFLTQSSSAAVLMLICTLKAGMIKIKSCFPVMIGINIFGAIAVSILAFDLKVPVYIVLGVAALVFTNDLFYRYRNIAGILIGIGLLFLGLYSIQGAVAGINNSSWFNNAILYVNNSYVAGFIIGIILSIVAQSSIIIEAIVMILYKSDVINLHSSIILVYGAYLGSSFLSGILSLNIYGEAKQLAIFQVLYNIVGNIILLPLIFCEIYLNIPGISSLVTSIFCNQGLQVIAAGLILDIVAGIAMMILLPFIAKILSRLYPETQEESISKPHYLFSSKVIDVVSAMKLVELEQARIIEANTHVLMMIREEKSKNLDQFFDGVAELTNIIREYLSVLPKKYSLEANMCIKLGLLIDIQNTIEMLSVSIRKISGILSDKSFFTSKEQINLHNAIIEGFDILFIATADVLHDRETPFTEYYTKMTANSEKEIIALREVLIRSLGDESSKNKLKLISLVSDSEKIIMLLNRTAQKIFSLKSDNAVLAD